MLDSLSKLLHSIPLWIWVTIPVIILAFGYYLFSKNRRQTLIVTSLALCVAIFTAGFHRYETYLSNHFLGGFDASGLPSYYSANGWAFFFTAWPIWLIPCCFVLVLAAVISHVISRSTSQTKADTPVVNKSKRVSQQLTIAELQKQISDQEKQIDRLKQQQQNQQNDNAELQKTIERQQLQVDNAKSSVNDMQQELETQQNRCRQLKDLLAR